MTDRIRLADIQLDAQTWHTAAMAALDNTNPRQTTPPSAAQQASADADLIAAVANALAAAPGTGEVWRSSYGDIVGQPLSLARIAVDAYQAAVEDAEPEPADDGQDDELDDADLAEALERAESARIDRDGDLWYPTPNGQWRLTGRRTPMSLAELEADYGPTRSVLIVSMEQPDEDETTTAPAPGSATRAKEPDPDRSRCPARIATDAGTVVRCMLTNQHPGTLHTAGKHRWTDDDDRVIGGDR